MILSKVQKKTVMIPEIIPIMRIEDFHTHYLGKTDDGRQFWCYNTFAFAKPFCDIQDNSWLKYKREYVVLHLFDSSGNYLESKQHFCGTADINNEEIISKKMNEFVQDLGKITYEDIAVKPFNTTIEDFIFGLIPNESYKTVDLEPSSTISFHEPWDGEYDT